MSGYDNQSGDESEDDFNPAPMIDEDDIKPTITTKRKPTVADDNDDEDEELAQPAKADDEDEGEDEEGAGDDVENDDEDDEDDEDEDEDEDEVVVWLIPPDVRI